ncbi:MAG: SCO family protein [Terricaulis sp.]
MMSPAEKPRRNLTGAVVPAVAAAALAAVLALVLVGQKNGQRQVSTDCVLQGSESMGGPISLVDTNGARVTESDFKDQPSVVYFGFTHCPDACPTTMYSLARALQEPGGYDIQPILITVDPARDTPTVLKQYVHSGGFPAGLVGLTGSQAQVDAAAAAFKAFHQARPIEGAPADAYNVDHSSLLYVMDRHWRTRAIISSVHATPADIAQCIAAGLERRG